MGPSSACPSSAFSNRRVYCSYLQMEVTVCREGLGKREVLNCLVGFSFDCLLPRTQEMLPGYKWWRWAQALDPSCQCMSPVWDTNARQLLIGLCLQTALLLFLDPDFLLWSWALSYWSTSHVFAKGISPPRHLRSIQALKYPQERQQREIGVTLSFPGGWTYCWFGLVLQRVGMKPKPKVLAPPEIKVSSFLSYRRQQL